MSSYRTRADTAAGAFSTLIVLLPWQGLEALGVDETSALQVAAGTLLLLSVIAFVVGRGPREGGTSFYMSVYRETFYVRAYLRAFAFYAWALLLLGATGWATVAYQT